MSQPLLAAQLASTLFMTGLIWFVQIVHYPLFGRVGSREFPNYESQHSSLTTMVVGPPMVIEAVTAILLVFLRPARMPAWAAAVGLALVCLIWLSTAFLQVPRHSQLYAGYDAGAHTALVQTNWLRTFAWTLRSFLLLWVVFRKE